MPYFMTVITNNMCQLIDANQNTLKHDKLFKFTSLLHSFFFFCVYLKMFYLCITYKVSTLGKCPRNCLLF